MTAPSPAGPWSEDGLQHERTSLAWVRTASTLFAVGVLLARQAESTTVGLVVLTAVAVLTTWVVFSAEGQRQARRDKLAEGASILALPQIVATTALALALAAAGLLVLLN